MNVNLETLLQSSVAALTRAENAKDIRGMTSAHKVVQNIVAQIYIDRVDVPTVLRTEQIINGAHGNVVGKTNEANKTYKTLSVQASTGLELHEKFERKAKMYAEWADATHKNVKSGKHSPEGVPLEPIRSGLTEFRKQLITDIASHRSVDPFPERDKTNRLRLDATVTAERDFLKRYIDNRKLPAKEKEKQKEKTLHDFDKRITRQTLPTRLR